MGVLLYWTVVIISYQTAFSIIVSWLTLSCRMHPSVSELHEVTLMKMLYLYDPEICGRVYFYNHTRYQGAVSKIVWPVKNEIATDFRKKISVWLTLHVLWICSCIGYLVQARKPCAVYTSLLLFTLTGVAVLLTDVAYTIIFLMDTSMTSTEKKTIEYINHVHYVRQAKHSWNTFHMAGLDSDVSEEDTSWIALLMAYCSCRAVVQWLVNFWVVKDNYFEGIAYCQKIKNRQYPM